MDLAPDARIDSKHFVRFWSKVLIGDGCWVWQGRAYPSGYAKFGVEWVHRVAYRMMVGAIPPRAQIDHVRARGCISRLCVRPDHLEAVTPSENVRRSYLSSPRTHCKHGHEFAPENIYFHANGKRRCRTCHRQQAYLRKHPTPSQTLP